MKKALTYHKLPKNKVRCQVCQRKCVIDNNQTGFCLTKINKNGELYTLNYGLIPNIQVDPIEKKPFYHFHPGVMVPSLEGYGCNFRCKQCLNWQCSWGEPASSTLKEIAQGKKYSVLDPKQLVERLKQEGYQGLAFTYNEPVVWTEYVLDVAKLAKKENLFTVFVTNGSWTKETLDKIGPFIDAANVDLKGFSAKTYTRQRAFFGQVPQMMEHAQKKHNILIEITTLLIPGVNDNPKELEKMTNWIVKKLGPKTPWHLSRFSPELAPDPEFQKIPPTQIETIKNAAETGKKSGLEFIYIWATGRDLPGRVYAKSDTTCPKCQNIAIKRNLWEPDMIRVDNKGKCKKCGGNLNIIL